ncbi:TetR/AcrR family transcriptional regulator [Sphingobium sp. AN641]|uniref:TetR/AcrR family transcriptional regulator n=1 Tax=Sphingobium sp. AN641 TaxID=3133443 RepID=UPI0030C3A03E
MTSDLPNRNITTQPGITGVRRYPSTRPPPSRGVSTVSAIIEAAERLWGARGVEGASLREISIAAGSANKSSIGYHFGDKHGLIEAVFRVRIPVLEARRQPMFAAAEAQGALGDPLTLLRIAFQPVFDEIDGQGRHSFAAFLRAVNRYPQWDSGAGIEKLAPVAHRALAMLRQQVSDLPQQLFDARLRLVYEICYGAITDQDDNPPAAGPDIALARKMFDDALRTCVHLLFIEP